MLKLRTLGGLSIENAALGGGLTAHRRPLAVLALLATEGRQGVSRDKIVALLWPESDSEHGRNSLSQVISILRRELAADDVVLGTAELRLNTDVLACDAIEFEQLIAANDLEAAIAIYAGPFLDGVFLRNTPDFEHWVDQERSRLHHVQGDALERLATRATAVGDHGSAVRYWRQRATLAPSDSQGAYKLMESLVALGDRAGALEHYRVHHSLLRDDLGLEPDATLAEFAARVRRGMSRSAVAPTDARPSLVAAADVSGPAASPARELRTGNAAPRRRTHWIAGVAVALTVVTVALGWRTMNNREASANPVLQLTHLLPDSTMLHSSGAALSPDGRTIVYAAVHEGTTPSPPRLYVLRLGEVQARLLEKTEGASYPFFSPDGGSVGFTVGDAIKAISLEDDGITTVATNLGLGGAGVADALWGDDGYILFGSNMDKQTIGIRRVSSHGGSVEVLSRPDHARGERAHYAPQRLPGTETLIYTVTTSDARGTTYRVVAQEPGGGASRDLIEGAILARYVDGGWLVYQIASDVFVSRFDVRTLALSGRTRLVDGVHIWYRGRAWAVNADILVYQPQVETRSTLVRVSRDGTRDTLSLPPDYYEGLDLSPSGDRIATSVRDGGLTDVWTLELHKSLRTKISSDGITGPPKWSPDGKRLTFRRRTSTGLDLYTRAADGTDAPELLFSNGGVLWPADWTRDMQTLVVMQHDTVSNGGDLWTLDIASKTLRPLVRSPKQDFGGRLSPDGRWLAFFSDISGRYELYVISFPHADKRWQVSRDGGRESVWSRDGRELFFRNGKELLVATIRPGMTFDWDPPRVLFEGDFFSAGGPGSEQYDVTPDGKHFLMLAVPPPGPARLNVFQGWRLGLDSVARR